MRALLSSYLNFTMVGELKKYSCDRCGNSFKTNYKRSLLRHIKNIHEGDVKKVMLKEEKRVRGGTHKCQEIAWCPTESWQSKRTSSDVYFSRFPACILHRRLFSRMSVSWDESASFPRQPCCLRNVVRTEKLSR